MENDEIIHPDGSQSKIPYWVRKKLSQLDTLAEEIRDFFETPEEEIVTPSVDYEDFCERLSFIREQITNIQEGEGWIS